MEENNFSFNTQTEQNKCVCERTSHKNFVLFCIFLLVSGLSFVANRQIISYVSDKSVAVWSTFRIPTKLLFLANFLSFLGCFLSVLKGKELNDGKVRNIFWLSTIVAFCYFVFFQSFFWEFVSLYFIFTLIPTIIAGFVYFGIAFRSFKNNSSLPLKQYKLWKSLCVLSFAVGFLLLFVTDVFHLSSSTQKFSIIINVAISLIFHFSLFAFYRCKQDKVCNTATQKEKEEQRTPTKLTQKSLLAVERYSPFFWLLVTLIIVVVFHERSIGLYTKDELNTYAILSFCLVLLVCLPCLLLKKTNIFVVLVVTLCFFACLVARLYINVVLTERGLPLSFRYLGLRLYSYSHLFATLSFLLFLWFYKDKFRFSISSKILITLLYLFASIGITLLLRWYGYSLDGANRFNTYFIFVHTVATITIGILKKSRFD